jgi:Pyruvate/2-oxoacid:ferredoxin oxidoreductase delta subunit
MSPDGNSAAWGAQNDPFGEDFFLVPPEEETRTRAEQVLRDNRDALRHCVEVAIWEALDQPEQLKVLMTLLWHWKDVDPRWMAEASFMTIAAVRDIAESQAVWAFPCLGCGVELTVLNRLHGIRLQGSVERYCSAVAEDGPPAKLLCKTCEEQSNDLAEQQRRLDDLRYQALLAEYRARPYAERRQTKEWAVIKNQIHRRDKYRCRLCGRDDLELHVHHSTYENYAQERLEDLITLCSACHYHFHFRSEAS